MTPKRTGWTCPVCGGEAGRPAFRRSSTRPLTEIRADELAPAASDFGTTLAEVVRCGGCGHGSLRERPSSETLAEVYAHVEDSSSLDEEDGQRATARRDLGVVRRHLTGSPGRLLDIGCWTGALLAEAGGLGWKAEGLEPSDWAAEQAASRGFPVVVGSLDDVTLEPSSYQVVVCCDVLEHLVDPGGAARRIAEALVPGGVLFATVPDAGSRLARAMGARWWSVLPMHVQYFTRASLQTMLADAGLEVLEVRTHPKVFTRRYYADRLGELVPAIGQPLAGAVGRTRWGGGAFAPDFRDRIAIVARRAGREEQK